MKLLHSILFLLFLSQFSFSQDKNDIAEVYFKKAQKSYIVKEYKKTERYLNKAIEYFEGLKRVDVASFGAKFYFNANNFIKAKEFLTAYFKLNEDKSSEDYNDMLLLYTDTLDAIDNPKTVKKEKNITSPKISTETKVLNSTIKDNIKKEVPVVDVNESQSNGEQGVSVKAKDVSFMLIEDVPVFPGCFGGKEELKNCFSRNIQTHFITHFNADLPNTLGLSAGRKRVFIGFTINTNGKVVKIVARAPHPLIEKEVVRVMELLPEIKPGTQRGKNVNVKYSIPFTLIVEGDVKKKE